MKNAESACSYDSQSAIHNEISSVLKYNQESSLFPRPVRTQILRQKCWMAFGQGALGSGPLRAAWAFSLQRILGNNSDGYLDIICRDIFFDEIFK